MDEKPQRAVHYPDVDYALAAVRAVRLWVSGGRKMDDREFVRALKAAADMLK